MFKEIKDFSEYMDIKFKIYNYNYGFINKGL